MCRIHDNNCITLFQLCDTYPKFLFVPSSVSTSILVGSSKFRSKERLPVLTYLHGNKVLLQTFFCFLKYSFFTFRHQFAAVHNHYLDLMLDVWKMSNFSHVYYTQIQVASTCMLLIPDQR